MPDFFKSCPAGALSHRKPTTVAHVRQAKSWRTLFLLSFLLYIFRVSSENIPVLYRSSVWSLLKDLPSRFEPILIGNKGIDGTEIGVSNAYPAVFKSAQLVVALKTKTYHIRHDE